MSLKTSSNHLLWGVLAAGGAGLLILLAFAVGSGSSAERVGGLSVPARIVPGWAEVPESGSAEAGGADPRELPVYLDTSHSMGGFVPPPGVESQPSFRAVVQLVPGHLVSRFEGLTRWLVVDRDLRRLDRAPAFERPLFTGSETCLNLAITDFVEALESGRVEAGVLVSDLVATCGPEGAMGAAETLLRWERTAAVRDGRFDLGLLAVRTPYWGVESSTCRGPGALGCWYSEHANRYLPLEEVVQRPVYFLFFGRAARGGGSVSRVEEAGRSFQTALDEQGLETRWELLTRGSRTRAGTLICSVGPGEDSEAAPGGQYALYRHEDGHFQCRRDEPVRLSCCVTDGGGGGEDRTSCDGDGMSLRSAEASWPGLAVRSENGRLTATLDCEALRREAPELPLELRKVKATAPRDEPGPWQEWSARSDEVEGALTGTLQMDLFVETVRLRPDHYRIELLEPLLRFEPRSEP